MTTRGIASPLSIVAASAALTLASAEPLAQGTPGAERTADRIVVDFVAVATDGRPIADLNPAEIIVRVDGKRRTVRSLQYLRAAAAESIDPAASAPVPPPYSTNDATSEGRLFYLVIDDDSFRAGREGPLRGSVDAFTRSLSPRDRIALVTVPYGGVKVAPTTDHARIRTALSTIVGQAPPSESGSEFACRTRRTLESLVGLMETFGVTEEPRTVIFVSSGLAGPRRDNVMMRAPGPCELTVDMYRQVGVSAGAARAQFYLVMPEDIMVRPGGQRAENIAGVGFQGSDNPFEGLENLAGVTGAHRMNLTGQAETAMGRISRETSGRYVASLAPEASDRNGRSRQLDVRVSRAGVVVRAAAEITFRKADALAGSTTVREMVIGGRAFADLPLRVAAFASHESDAGASKVVAIVESPDREAKFATLAAVLVDEHGRPAAQWTGSGSDITGRPVIFGLLAAPGVYRLRVGAIDAIGRGGTVDSEVDATLASAGPLKLSSLMLGLSRDGAFNPKLHFGAEPVAIGYLEIYGGSAGLRVTATLEVARSLNGPAIHAVPLALAPGDRRHIATGAIPIGALPDGDYAVRALIAVDGHPTGRVVQTLRKTQVR